MYNFSNKIMEIHVKMLNIENFCGNVDRMRGIQINNNIVIKGIVVIF